MDVLDANITEVYEQSRYKDKIGPIAVKFQHAELELGSKEGEITDLSKFKPKLKKLESSSDQQEMDVEVAVKLKNVIYSNKASSVKGHRPDPYKKTFFAVRNKRTNEMQMYEMQNVVLGPQVSFPETTNTLLRSEVTPEKQEKGAMRKLLVSKFGQAKGQRIFEQSDRMKVEESQIEKKINKTTEDLDTSNVVLPDDGCGSLRLTPPCDRKAKSVEDVYNLNDIFTEYEQSMLKEVDQQFLEKYSSEKILTETKDLCPLAKVIALNFLLRNKKTGYGQILYLDQMMKVLTMRAKALDKRTRGLNQMLPYPLQSKIFDSFLPQKRFSPESKDRCICYALVLALLLNQFQIPMESVLSSMHLKKDDKVRRLMLFIGGSVQKDALTEKNYAILKIPLTKYDANKFLKFSARNK